MPFLRRVLRNSFVAGALVILAEFDLLWFAARVLPENAPLDTVIGSSIVLLVIANMLAAALTVANTCWHRSLGAVLGGFIASVILAMVCIHDPVGRWYMLIGGSGFILLGYGIGFLTMWIDCERLPRCRHRGIPLIRRSTMRLLLV